MLLNSANLAALGVGYRSEYNRGFTDAESYYAQLATTVPSMTRENTYPWLGEMPGIREWIGEREVRKLSQFDYTIRNKPWEMTISVDRDHIEDDQYGVYSPMFANMGFETARFPDQLIFNLLSSGFAQTCYDGQYFFDNDHPGYNAAGLEVSVTNVQAGAANPWYLLDTRRPLKPLVYQLRRAFDLVAKNARDDDNVFWRKEYIWGVEGRMNCGYGFWQQAYGSKAALDATSFNLALTTMMGLKRRAGQPLGIKPNILVCGPSNRATALEVVKAERNAAGATNINRDAVDVLVVEWLA